jgi:hypothetical protein
MDFQGEYMKNNSSKEYNVPKHLQKRKDFQRKQELANEEKKNKMQVGTVLIIVAFVIGAGLFVYNIDDFYLNEKKNITLSYSAHFQQGSEAPIIITLNDFNDDPVEGEKVKLELEYTQNNQTKVIDLGTSETASDGAITPIIELPDNYNGTAQLIVSVADQKVKQEIEITEPSVVVPGVVPYQDEEHLKILVSIDKPIYQPGQTINIRTLALYGENKGVYTDKLTVEVDDPDGNKLYRAELDCNEYGIASTNFTVTDQMPIGNYKIMAKVGEVEAQRSTTVKRYVLPRFNIALDGIKSWYTVEEDITGTVNCNYFFGKPVKGEIAFKARTYYGGIWATVYTTSGTLTDDGQFTFTVPAVEYAVGLPFNQDNGLVELNVTITDPSGHHETKLTPITIARQPILITAISDTNIKGAESRYYILTQAPDGSIVDAANLTAKVDTEVIFDGITDDKGLAELKFEYDGQEELGVTVEKSGAVADEIFTIKAGKGLKLVADKMYYKLGERAEFDVFYSGETYTRWAYYDVIASGFTVKTGCLKLSSGTIKSGSFKIDLTPEMVGSIYVRVYKIEKDETLVSDKLELAIAPVSDLEVKIEKDDDIYNPNQPAKIRFTVTQEDKAVSAALGYIFRARADRTSAKVPDLGVHFRHRPGGRQRSFTGN